MEDLRHAEQNERSRAGWKAARKIYEKIVEEDQSLDIVAQKRSGALNWLEQQRLLQQICNVTIPAYVQLGELIVASAESEDDLVSAQLNFAKVLEIMSNLEDNSGFTSWRLTSRGNPLKMKAEHLASRARDALAMLWMQSEDSECNGEVAQLLTPFGFEYRLSSEIICYQKMESPLFSRLSFFACAIDKALPQDMFHFMSCAFAEDSAFWNEHAYRGWGAQASGYFSYLHSLDFSRESSSGLEQVIRFIFRLVQSQNPTVSNAKFAEWWVHCRPHSAGHQLHFDSDNEGRGGVRNPIVSTVLYLEACGGPTLVTNQQFGECKLADEGCLIFPEKNRLGMFDGSLLHGVIPGKGIQEGMRVTFMVAFWENASFADDSEAFYDADGKVVLLANRRFPDNDRFEWTKALTKDCKSWEHMGVDEVTPVKIQTVSSIWSKLSDSDDYEGEERFPEYDAIFQGF